MKIQWTHDLADQPSSAWPTGVMLDSYGRPYRIGENGQIVFINYGDCLIPTPQDVQRSIDAETEAGNEGEDGDDDK